MFPEQFKIRMQKMLQDEYEEFENSFDGNRYHALRINPLKAERDKVMESMKTVYGEEISFEKVPWSENGYYYDRKMQPGKHPYHEAGVYYIQEPSAMAPVTLLDPQPGERILDLCAAPGGKSTQIAAAMKGKGILICNEIHPARAKILSENVERMGIRNAIVTNETPDRLEERFAGYFDRILVDAPCSGEGMFRKNEEATEEWSPENVQMCADRQDDVIESAYQMLRPGGILCYSTCTFAPAENEGTISRLLARHEDMSICEIPEEQYDKGFQPGRPEWSEKQVEGIEKTIRLWPHRLKGEGHYAAVLKKTGGFGPAENDDGKVLAEEIGRTVRKNRGQMKKQTEKKSAVKKNGEAADFPEFAAAVLKTELTGTMHWFGDQLYLAPEGMPPLHGLKVLRPGLHLGTDKKGRFEPSHALALALKPDEVVNSFSVDSKTREATAWLNGETFAAEGEKGWYLICVDGFSIGWGKLAGGVMKNHYPKGLRKSW